MDAENSPYTSIHKSNTDIFLHRGVPAVVDFAAMRDAVRRLGGDPSKINPISPADLVIDHSVQADFSRRFELDFVSHKTVSFYLN